MSESLISIALEWLRFDELLKKAKADEAEKRAELVLRCFPAGVKQGTNTVKLGRGYAVKAVVRPAPKMPDVPAVRAAQTKLVALGEAGALIAGRLIKWKPELSIGEWKKLSPQHRKLFRKAVTIGDSTPSVELVQPE